MMASWSIDSGDTYDTVSVGSGSGGDGNNTRNKQPQHSDTPFVKNGADNDAKPAINTSKEEGGGVAPASAANNASPSSSLPSFQYYQVAHSTEINSEDRAFFGISAPRGRDDRSHRTVRFRFGVLNSSSGQRSVGEDEEHEVVLSWSVRTGKRIISYDRIILYTLTLRGFGVCDHTLLTPDGKFSLRILSCTDAPLGSSKDFETSEVIVNGISYYDLPTMGMDGSLVKPKDCRSGTLVDEKTGRKILTTVGQVLCPDVIEMSRKEVGFEDEEEDISSNNDSPRSVASS